METMRFENKLEGWTKQKFDLKNLLIILVFQKITSNDLS